MLGSILDFFLNPVVDSVIVLIICISSLIYSRLWTKSKKRGKLKDAQIETLEKKVESLQNEDKE